MLHVIAILEGENNISETNNITIGLLGINLTLLKQYISTIKLLAKKSDFTVVTSNSIDKHLKTWMESDVFNLFIKIGISCW